MRAWTAMTTRSSAVPNVNKMAPSSQRRVSFTRGDLLVLPAPARVTGPGSSGTTEVPAKHALNPSDNEEDTESTVEAVTESEEGMKVLPTEVPTMTRQENFTENYHQVSVIYGDREVTPRYPTTSSYLTTSELRGATMEQYKKVNLETNKKLEAFREELHTSRCRVANIEALIAKDEPTSGKRPKADQDRLDTFTFRLATTTQKVQVDKWQRDNLDTLRSIADLKTQMARNGRKFVVQSKQLEEMTTANEEKDRVIAQLKNSLREDAGKYLNEDDEVDYDDDEGWTAQGRLGCTR